MGDHQQTWKRHVGIGLGCAVATVITPLNIAIAQAQITPDGSFQTTVTPTAPGQSLISGGKALGDRLFHSFSEFSVPTGGAAIFNSSPKITTIFSRITGDTASNIDGLLRTPPQTSLYLLNPNGLIFGPNAALSIGGSFVGTTADTVQFEDGSYFGRNDDSLSHQTNSLLTIQPSALQFSSATPASISQQSQLQFFGQAIGLNVNPDSSLILAGGEIALPGGAMTSLGGHLELVSLSEAGTVNLVGTDKLNNQLQTQVPSDIRLGSITLSQDAQIAVPATPGGSIALKGGDITITNSKVLGGILEFFSPGQADQQAGNVELLAQGNVSLDGSQLLSDVFPNATGNSGKLRIEAQDIAISNGTLLSSSVQGIGNSGGLELQVSNSITIDAQLSNGDVSHIITGVLPNGVGNAGGLHIKTGDLSLYNGGFIAGSTLGEGRGGEINIQASGDVVLDGVRQGPTPRYASSLSQTAIAGGSHGGSFDSTGANGNGGDISIRAKNLYVRNGALLASFARGVGASGNLNLDIEEKLELTGHGRHQEDNDFLESYITTSVDRYGVGDGGNLNIRTGSLLVQDGNYIATSTTGAGNAGNLTIEARDNVRFRQARTDSLPSFAASSVEINAIGQGGEIRITAPEVIFEEGSGLTARTLGDGHGGDIVIESDRLKVENGAQIFTSSFGPGDAGDLQISATESVVLSETESVASLFQGQFIKNEYLILGGGSSTGLYANTSESSLGNGGTVYLRTPQLRLSNDAQINVSSLGMGNAGNLQLKTQAIALENSSLLAQSRNGGQGNISIAASEQILLDQGSSISTNAIGDASGGNIAIASPYLLSFNNSDITANSETAFGGSVQVNADFVLGTEYRPGLTQASDITATSAQGAAFKGVVDLQIQGLDPTVGRLPIPTVGVTTQETIITSCQITDDEQFLISGRGGLPSSASQPMPGFKLWQDSRVSAQPIASHAVQAASTPKPSPAWVEAQSLRQLSNGKFQLVAQARPKVGSAPHCPSAA